MFLRSLTTSIWLRKKCNDIFTYQQLELVARHLHPELAVRTCSRILTIRLRNSLVNAIVLNLDILLCQN